MKINIKDKYKTLICCYCSVLIFYSIIKLISGKSFEIVCENETMQNRY